MKVENSKKKAFLLLGFEGLRLSKSFCIFFILLFFVISGQKTFAQNDSIRQDSAKSSGFSKNGGKNTGTPSITPPPSSFSKDTTKKSFGQKDTLSSSKIAGDTTQNDSSAKWKVLAKKTLQFLDKELYPEDIRKLLKPRRDSFPDPSIAYKRAMLFAGWGQIYNRKYWKLPLVYGILGIPVYLAYTYNNQYQKLRKAYTYSIDNDPSTDPASIKYEYGLSTSDGLRTAREEAHRQRDNYIMYSGIVYALQVVEAFVDAHLQSFEVSDNLSLKVQPSFLPTTNSVSGQTQIRSGIGLSVRF